MNYRVEYYVAGSWICLNKEGDIAVTIAVALASGLIEKCEYVFSGLSTDAHFRSMLAKIVE